MYIAVLFVHSWLRWIVLALGLAVLLIAIRNLKAVRFEPSHDRVHAAFLGTLDLQFLLGVVLYFFLSPVTQVAFADMGAAMKEPQLRYFAVEHIAAMFIAVALAHIGRVRSKRKSGGARYRTTLVFQVIWFVLTVLAIPWPGLDIARPLFRT